MSTIIREMHSAMIAAMGVEGLKIPMTAVKFFKNGEDLPAPVMHNHIKDITLTNCQASRQASLGDAVCLTRDNIGCVAAAISIGFVDKDDEKPLGGSRVYTDIMRDQSGLGDSFVPPAPPLIHGGEQEFGLRAGTENVGSIAALGEASRLIHAEVDTDNYGTIRFSFGLRTTKEDLVYMFKYLPYILENLGAGGKIKQLPWMLTESNH